jgi:hypothetical protein
MARKTGPRVDDAQQTDPEDEPAGGVVVDDPSGPVSNLQFFDGISTVLFPGPGVIGLPRVEDLQTGAGAPQVAKDLSFLVFAPGDGIGRDAPQQGIHLPLSL